MPRYYKAKDINLFSQINKELINSIIDTKIDLYKLNKIDANVNIYNENINKVYYNAIPIAGLINREEPDYDFDEDHTQEQQSIKIRFLKRSLKDIDVVIEKGDIIKYDEKYYKIMYVLDNQYIGGNVVNKFSIICDCVLTNESMELINEIEQYVSSHEREFEKNSTNASKEEISDDSLYHNAVYDQSIYQ